MKQNSATSRERRQLSALSFFILCSLGVSLADLVNGESLGSGGFAGAGVKKELNDADLLPSEALLEFLVEFSEVDNETFDLIVQRAQNDVETSQQVEAKTGVDSSRKVLTQKGTEHD